MSMLKKGNSSIPIFDTKPLSIDSDLASKSDSISQGSPLISRLPSLKPQANRQKLSLSTRKCVTSSVTPISSPIIPKNINNNLQHHQIGITKYSSEIIESSARLINEIDATLSQLSDQYYADNNNLTEVPYTPVNDEDWTPTSQRNNNCISHTSNTTSDSCDCKMLNKFKFKKPQTNNIVTDDHSSSTAIPKSSVKQSHIPNLYRENTKQKSLQSRPTKLQFTNESNKSLEINENNSLHSSYRSLKSSTGKKSKSSTLNRTKPQESTLNSDATYTEAWIYNSRLPVVNHEHVNHSNNLVQYMTKEHGTLQSYPKVYYPLYQTSTSANSELFQKAIFNQHRHSSKIAIPNETISTQKYSQKLPMPSKKVKNNKDDLSTNRDSGISSSSCSKESWADLASEIKLSFNNNNNNNNNNINNCSNNISNGNIVTTNNFYNNNNNNTLNSLPQPPPRISSLVQVSQKSIDKCMTLTNQCNINKDYLISSAETKPACKADRRKARELFASVKQRDEQRMKFTKVDDVKSSVTENSTKDFNRDIEEIKPKLKDIRKDEVAETPNSDLESGIVEGYCSDMDNLKNSGYCSDNSGYMSEGGLGLYAQKMQQRFREGLLAVQESLKLTSNNKIINRKFETVGRDDLSSTSSEEIEDYLKELSNRLVSPVKSELSELRQNNENHLQRRNSATRIQSVDLPNSQMERKYRMYQERLQKYANDVEPAADFDITSSCSMDLLTGKAISDVGSEEEASEFKDYFGGNRQISDIQKESTQFNCGNNAGKQTKSTVESIGKTKSIANNKLKSGGCEILEAAGPTPATFEDDADLRVQENGRNHYRAMSLPGRQRKPSAWEIDVTSLSRMETSHIQPPINYTSVYYDVPFCRSKQNRNNGSSTPSLMNIRLPYATISQGVKSSLSTCSLGKRDDGSDDIYDGIGSHLSLLSNSSYRSLNEERQATEIRKLRRELEMAQQKVRTLSGQLSNNGNLVTAFENSLQSMSLRLQKFAASSESKENELNELKNTIDLLKKQASSNPNSLDQNPGKIYSTSSLTSLICNSNSIEKRSDGSSKKSSWLKNSLGRAFKKKSSKFDGSTESINDIHQKQIDNGSSISQSMTESESLHALRKELEEKDARLTDVQLDALSRSHQLEQLRDLLTKMRYEMSSLKADNNRLQSLMTLSNAGVSSQSLEQSVNDSSEQLDQNSLHKNWPKLKDLSTRPKFDFLNALVKEEESCLPLVVYVILNNNNKFPSCPPSSALASDNLDIPIGRVGITSMTSWSDLENNLRRLVKEYMSAIDSFSSLGLNGESIARYRINNESFISVSNTGSMRPLTSPLAACFNKSNSKISIELKNHVYSNSIDDMVFDCLIPKSILQRYFGLLLEHKRVFLCGPSGTGKTYLAYKLAENIACRYNRDPTTSILTFNVDHKSTKELRSYMATLTEQLLKSDPQNDFNVSTSSSLPLVIILDNLHHVSSFSEIFNSFLSIHHMRSPFVIGTMSQSNSSNTKNLQLHHNFRWILYTNHMEPVKGYLGRYLRRQFLKHQIESGLPNDQLYHIIEWIYIVWQHINKFLESYSSADVTIGPRLFLNCPMNIDNAKAWFVDLWNYSIVPYIIEAVREGLTLHGRKQATWEDPTDWVIRSWPWNDIHSSLPISNNPTDPSNLIRLRAEDVGFDSYQLIITTSDHMSPYSMNSHFGLDSLNSNRLSSTYDRRMRCGEKSENSEPLMNMLYRMQKRA